MSASLAAIGMSDFIEPAASEESGSSVPSLMARIHRGDESAFQEVYRRQAFPLYSRMLSQTSGDEAEARCLVQDAMLRLLKAPPKCQNEEHLGAWLARVGRNLWLDRLRKEKRHPHVPLEDFDQTQEIPPILLTCLRESLGQLPAADAELLRLAYIDRIPLQQIADDLGVTYKALEGRLSRIKNSAREHLLSRLRHENQS